MKRTAAALLAAFLILTACTAKKDPAGASGALAEAGTSDTMPTYESLPPTTETPDRSSTSATLDAGGALSNSEKREALIQALAELPQNRPPERYEDMPYRTYTASDPSPDGFIYSQISASQTVEYGVTRDGRRSAFTSSICIPRLKSGDDDYGAPAIVNWNIEYNINKYRDIIRMVENGTYTGQREWNISYSASVLDNVAVIVLHVSKGVPHEEPVVVSYPFYCDISENTGINITEYLACFGYEPEELTEAIAVELRKGGIEYDDPFLEQVEYLVYHGDKRFIVVLSPGTAADDSVTIELEVEHTALGDLKRVYNKALDVSRWFSGLGGPEQDYFYHVTHDINAPGAVVKPYEPDYTHPYWFLKYPSPLNYKGGYYYKIKQPGFETRDNLRQYLSEIYSKRYVDMYMNQVGCQSNENENYPYGYREIDGMLWIMEGARGSDVSLGRASYYLKELTDTRAVMTAKIAYTDEVLEIFGDYKYFDFVFELIGGMWLITTFHGIW